MPCVNRPANGSSSPRWPVLLHRPREEAGIEQMQDRVLDAADILIDRQPGVGDVGRRRRRLRSTGSVKRAKYQDEFDERVHRVGLAPRRPPHCGQATCFQVGWRSSGLPGASKVTSSGSAPAGPRPGPERAASLAMDDRDRAAPIALARNAPVAQLVIDLTLRPAADCPASRLEPARDLLLGGGDRHAVEEARVDHHPVAVIGDLVDA